MFLLQLLLSWLSASLSILGGMQRICFALFAQPVIIINCLSIVFDLCKLNITHNLRFSNFSFDFQQLKEIFLPFVLSSLIYCRNLCGKIIMN